MFKNVNTEASCSRREVRGSPPAWEAGLRLRLTGGVPADVADVLLGDALLRQPHAHAVLPAQALFTLRGKKGSPGHTAAAPRQEATPPPLRGASGRRPHFQSYPTQGPNADLG